MSDPKKFSHSELAALREIVLGRAPALGGLMDRLGQVPLTIEERDTIQLVLADELLETGLRPDDEPNARGILIDDMIGRLMYY